MIDASEPVTRGDFTAQAEFYAKARPTYPIELLDGLMPLVRVWPAEPVADVGAGTGLFTALLAARGLRVAAVEPNAGMRAQAVTLPDVRWIAGSFESTGLPAQSQRWVVAAQAFHWADPLRALPEIARILQPGCCFTVVWNNRVPQKHPVLDWTSQMIKSLVPEFQELYQQRDWFDVLTSTGHFGQPTDYRECLHTVRMTSPRFMDLWRSHNHLGHIAGPQRRKQIIDQLERHLREQRIEEIDVPYICKAWTVTVNANTSTPLRHQAGDTQRTSPRN